MGVQDSYFRHSGIHHSTPAFSKRLQLLPIDQYNQIALAIPHCKNGELDDSHRRYCDGFNRRRWLASCPKERESAVSSNSQQEYAARF